MTAHRLIHILAHALLCAGLAGCAGVGKPPSQEGLAGLKVVELVISTPLPNYNYQKGGQSTPFPVHNGSVSVPAAVGINLAAAGLVALSDNYILRIPRAGEALIGPTVADIDLASTTAQHLMAMTSDGKHPH